MVCDKVVCERWWGKCVRKMVCDKDVCERWCETKRFVTEEDAEEEEEATRRRRTRGVADLKTRTPHNVVGNRLVPASPLGVSSTNLFSYSCASTTGPLAGVFLWRLINARCQKAALFDGNLCRMLAARVYPFALVDSCNPEALSKLGKTMHISPSTDLFFSPGLKASQAQGPRMSGLL